MQGSKINQPAKTKHWSASDTAASLKLNGAIKVSNKLETNYLV